MAQPKKTLHERALEAEGRANDYLASFNEWDERGLGHTPRAQEMWRKGQFWLDRWNLLTGHGEKSGPRA